MLIKCIATDLDGTLLNSNGILTAVARKVLAEARSRDIAVVAVTGRPPRGIDNTEGLTESIDMALCLNGAVTYRPYTGTTHPVNMIDRATAETAIERLNTALPEAGYAIETGVELIAQTPHFTSVTMPGANWSYMDTIGDILAKAPDIAEIKMFSHDLNPLHMLETAKNLDLEGLNVWHWGDVPLLEFSHQHATKGKALQQWCEAHNILAEEVVAFGDMPNDVSMLQWAGASYAVASAHPDAIAASKGMTASNDEDGVALALRELLSPLTGSIE